MANDHTGPGYCPKCQSTNVTMTAVYGYPGTGPRGRARLGDAGGGTRSECKGCGHGWYTPSKVVLKPMGEDNAMGTFSEATSGPPPGSMERVGDVSSAGGTEPEQWVQHIDQHIQNFKALQAKHGRHGARDTEPDWHFENMLRNTLHGHEPEIPRSAREWELYTVKSQPGVGTAGRELTSAAGQTHRALKRALKHANPEVRRAVYNHVRGRCWRVEIDPLRESVGACADSLLNGPVTEGRVRDVVHKVARAAVIGGAVAAAGYGLSRLPATKMSGGDVLRQQANQQTIRTMQQTQNTMNNFRRP